MARRNELTALRLSAQLIAGSSLERAGDVVRWMLAMQAQDLPGARWSVGLRLPGSTDASIQASLATGEVVRSWPMRGTLHLVAPEDLGWMLAISGPRQAQWAAKRRADLDISEAQLARAGDIAVDAMRGGRSIRRDLLLRQWQREGISTAGQRGYHLLWNLGHAALIVFGPPDGKQPTFALMEEWVHGARRLDGDEALGEFAARYFRSHGPATVKDFAWWANITLGDARRGLAIAAPTLDEQEFDGVPHHFRPGLKPAPSAAYSLPGFDEYMLGYRDRSPAVSHRFSDRVVPGNNGIFLPTIVVDGQVVGTWRRTESARAVTVEVSGFAKLTGTQLKRVETALHRYSEFLGKDYSLVTR